MTVELANLRDRLAKVAALLEAAEMAARDLPRKRRTPIRTLLDVAGDKLAGARAVAANIERSAARAERKAARRAEEERR
jgi:hypothetical protein